MTIIDAIINPSSTLEVPKEPYNCLCQKAYPKLK